MRTVYFRTMDLTVVFDRIDDALKGHQLKISVDVPVDTVRNKLRSVQEFKRRIQFFPGLAFLYHVLQQIEDAILEEMKE